jgi:hypothetical protein
MLPRSRLTQLGVGKYEPAGAWWCSGPGDHDGSVISRELRCPEAKLRIICNRNCLFLGVEWEDATQRTRGVQGSRRPVNKAFLMRC